MGTTNDTSRSRNVLEGGGIRLRSGMTGVIAFTIATVAAADAVFARAETDPGKVDQKALAQGRELFVREWQPGDSRSPSGDGLGPVYNDTSCVACHNLGGTGGGGSTNKNVQIVTATPVIERNSPFDLGVPVTAARPDSNNALATNQSPRTGPNEATPQKLDTAALVKAHPGFRTARSLVLHRFGTVDHYGTWRGKFMGIEDGFMGVEDATVKTTIQSLRQTARADFSTRRELVRAASEVELTSGHFRVRIDQFEVLGSQRNPTALFGSGLIDAIPDSAIEQAAQAKYPGFPEIAGRVSTLKDKRIGRIGWKGQTASLAAFVLTACAVELGLEVPGHHQAGSPDQPDYKAKGFDLTSDQCDAARRFYSRDPQAGGTGSCHAEGIRGDRLGSLPVRQDRLCDLSCAQAR